MNITARQRRSRSHCFLPHAARGFIGGLCLLLLPPIAVQAQVLNQRVGELLSNNCALLLQGAGSGVLGPQLAATCTSSGGTAITGAGASGGGGAAAVQTAAASIMNRNLLSRLEELREEEGEKKTKSASLIGNPLGMLAPGMMRGFSLASPTSPVSEGSGAMFNTATQSRWNGLGLFATGLVEALNRDITTYQDGYKSTILGFTVGGDYRFNRQTVAGITINYANTHGDFDSGGDFNTNSIGTTLFASYLPTDRSFVQVTGGYTRNNYLVSRLATAFVQAVTGPNRLLSGNASSNSDADVFSLSAIAGYDHPIGRWTVGPRLGLNFNNTHIGDYAENGSSGLELRYTDQWVNSLQSVLGVQAQAAFSTDFGVVVPQFNADYIHEFANSQRSIGVAFVQDNRTNPFRFTFQNDRPDRDFFNLGLGLVTILRNGLQPWIHFRAMTGNSQFQDFAGTFGLRVEM